jgi:hypothetical protein
MYRKVVLILGAVLLLGLTAYASNLMVKVDRPLTPKPDQALIIFMRLPASFGKAFLFDDYGQSVSLHDVSGNDTKLLGIVKGGTKVSYDVVPGEYTFMVVGEAADFMKATVAAGKIYYVLVTPRVGFWQARYSLRPLRQSDFVNPDFPKWESSTYLVDNTPESEEWAKKHATDIEKKRARYWPEWSAKTLEERDPQTLKLEDGR